MFEELVSPEELSRHPSLGLLLGACYAAIGIGIAFWLFPEDPALIAVALITLMFYPTLSSFMKKGETLEAKRKEGNPFTFIRDHLLLYRVYAGFFLGVFFVFSLFSLTLPSLATNHLFRNQMELFIGGAAWSTPLFFDLLSNNLLVLFVIFLSALFIGEGGILLITWNASVWGTIFGSLARNASLATDSSPFGHFFVILFTIFPHMILEAIGYITTAISGGIISKGLIKEKARSNRFFRILFNTVVALAIAAALILLGAFVETFVLQNADAYREIIKHSIG